MGLFMDISPTQTRMPVLYSSQMLKHISIFILLSISGIITSLLDFTI